MTAHRLLSSPRRSSRMAATSLVSVTGAVEIVRAAQRLGLVAYSHLELVEVAERRVRDILVWRCRRHAKIGARPEFIAELQRCYGGRITRK